MTKYLLFAVVVGGWLLADTVLAQPAEGDLKSPRTLRIDQEVGSVVELNLFAGQNRLLLLSVPIGRVSVADPDIADLKVVTPTQLLLTAKKAGMTDMTLWDRKDQPLVVALSVKRNLEALRTQLKELFPDEKIVASVVADLVVLTGEVSDVRIPERLSEIVKLHTEKFANLVRVSGDQQVQIEVKFAEVARGNLREMGFNFFHKSATGRQVAGLSSSRSLVGNFLNVPGTGSSGPLGAFGGQPPELASQPFGDAFSIFLSAFTNEFPFSVMLNILESQGLSKTLAEPTLVTLSGQEAKFLAGGELPIPISGSLGQVSVMWKEFGILLKFTPTVTGKDTIHLKLKAEVSELDRAAGITIGGFTIPGLITRQSQTTVRLGDGQSFAIAGLLSDKIRSNIEEIPFLGRLPVLGALFRSTSFRRNETELLVIVSAHLVHPLAPHQMPPLPTEYEHNDVGDLELFLMGWDSSTRPSNATTHLSRPKSGRGPSGSVGFAR